VKAHRFLGALGALVFALSAATTGIAVAQEQPDVQTPLGPISAADKDLLVKVKQASLWEGPVGEEAQTRSGNQRVREVGLQLAADHRKLDERLAALAGKMRVALPTTVNPAQQSWIDELRGLNGKPFDTAFADRLRAAHGQGFDEVARVRMGTRNQAIREFAQATGDVIAKHMTMLESTGLVTEAGMAVPMPAGGTPGDSALAARAGQLGGSSPLMIGSIVLVGVIVTITLLRLTKPRPPVN
jgi:putative membrane protein